MINPAHREDEQERGAEDEQGASAQNVALALLIKEESRRQGDGAEICQIEFV